MSIAIIDTRTGETEGHIRQDGYPEAETEALKQAFNDVLDNEGRVATLVPIHTDDETFAYKDRLLAPDDVGYLKTLDYALPYPFGLEEGIRANLESPATPTEQTKTVTKEQLEIRDCYRVWVDDPEDIPDGKEGFHDPENGPAENTHYYEVPFTTSTTIDIGDGNAAQKAKSVLVDKQNRPDITREDLVAIEVPEKDLIVHDAVAKTLADGEYLLAESGPTQHDTHAMRQVESPVTLLKCYQMAHEADEYQAGVYTALKNELDKRGVAAVERATKTRETLTKESRVYVDTEADVPDGYQAEQGPQGGTYYQPNDAAVDDNETAQQVDERPMATEEVRIAEIEDFEGVTLRFYTDDTTTDLDVVEAYDDPTTLMGPNAGYLVLEDGTAANLTGDRFEEGLIPEDYELRELTDANALIETEQYDDPAGTTDVAEWDIQWDGETKWDNEMDRDLLRLPADEKDQFMEEWRAAASDEGVENVETGLRGIKGATTTTGGMFMDKVMQAAWGIGGDPRHPDDMEDRDFEIADDPTEADVEAAKAFTKASRQFMDENYGEEFTLHRGLGFHVVEDLYPRLIEKFRDGDTEGVTMRDNPVATWTTGEKLANSYDKGIIARKQFTLDDVLSTPEALLDFEDHGSLSDWNEGEVNVPGWEMDTDLSELYVSDTDTTFEELIEDPIQAELDDESSFSPIGKFMWECETHNNVRAIEDMIGRIKQSEVYEQNPEALEEAFEAAQSAWDYVMDVKADPTPAETTDELVDIRHPGNWLVDARLDDSETDEKARVYVNDRSEVPDDYEFHEGPQGGHYYETDSTSEGQARFGEEPDENAHESTLTGGREIPNDDLFSGDLERDLEVAASEGSIADVNAVLDDYDAQHQKSVDGTDYYTTLYDDEWRVIEVGDDHVETTPFREWVHDFDWENPIADFIETDINEAFNNDFWRSEDETYHVTSPENAASILVDGELETRNKTRGIGNRGVSSAVFTSRNSPMDVYGDVTLEIDVEEMKADGFTPTVEQEPQIHDIKEREAVAHELGIHGYQPEYPMDVSADTAIFYDDIPFDYIDLKASDETKREMATHIEQMVANGDVSADRGQEVVEWLEESIGKAASPMGKIGIPGVST